MTIKRKKKTLLSRYLRVLFDQRLHWRAHFKHIEDRTESRIGLIRFLRKISPESNDTIMLNLYKALIRSVVTYGSSILLNAEEKMWNRLEVVQNKALTAALGIPHFTFSTYVRKLTNIPYVRAHVTQLTERALVRSKILKDEVTEHNIFRLLHR